jgi:hypothetical protein
LALSPVSSRSIPDVKRRGKYDVVIAVCAPQIFIVEFWGHYSVLRKSAEGGECYFLNARIPFL